MRRNTFKPQRKFERLEDRRMMAADINFDKGIVTVQGTENQDHVIVQVNPDESDEILVSIRNLETGELVLQEDFDRDNVVKVVANGYGNDDYFQNFTGIRGEFFGGAGNDDFEGGSGNDLLDGGDNDDSFIGGRGNDTMIGGSGNDLYKFLGEQLGADTVQEAANVDTDTLDFNGLAGGISVNLAATTQQIVNSTHLRLTISSNTGIENASGGSFVDRIYGNSRINELSGFGSGDYLWGRDGGDTLKGGSGDDWLYGEGGDDRLDGGADKDNLYGGANNDDLSGGNGDDKLYGEAGVDTLNGGADNDLLDGGYSPAIGPIVRDQLTGGSGVDTFVRHRKTLQPTLRFEDFLDFNPAVDRVLEVWH